MITAEIGGVVLAGIFILGAVPKLIGVSQSRAIAARLHVPYGVFRLIGCCELAGGLGLLAGVLVAEWIGVAAAIGLTLLALAGCGAHFRAREPWTAYLPALVLGSATAVLAFTL